MCLVEVNDKSKSFIEASFRYWSEGASHYANFVLNTTSLLMPKYGANSV